jgi:hypothetical protein
LEFNGLDAILAPHIFSKRSPMFPVPNREIPIAVALISNYYDGHLP